MLPKLMIAPNGARRTKADHPALPITLAEIIAAAKACQAEGADGLHLHLRDRHGAHVIDAGMYREALAECAQALPGMAVQITTEAAGKYSPAQQQAVALDSGAGLVSVSIREMAADPDASAAPFYQACHDKGIAVQHILYDPEDFDLLHSVLSSDLFDDPALQLIYVLGRYSGTRTSAPDDLLPFLARQRDYGLTPDWAACAFGVGETACLLKAKAEGGKLRIGFENSLWHADGSLAKDNADRVRALIAALPS